MCQISISQIKLVALEGRERERTRKTDKDKHTGSKKDRDYKKEIETKRQGATEIGKGGQRERENKENR